MAPVRSDVPSAVAVRLQRWRRRRNSVAWAIGTSRRIQGGRSTRASERASALPGSNSLGAHRRCSSRTGSEIRGPCCLVLLHRKSVSGLRRARRAGLSRSSATYSAG